MTLPSTPTVTSSPWMNSSTSTGCRWSRPRERIDVLKLRLGFDKTLVADPFARAFPGGLDDDGKMQIIEVRSLQGGIGREEHILRHDHAGSADEPFGAILIERHGHGQRIGAGERDAEHFENGRHAGFRERLTPALRRS